MFTFALDAGHGLNTAGKRCLKAIDPKETREWVLNNRIAVKVTQKLKDYEGIKVVRTDDPTGKTDTGLTARCDKANKAGADFFLSVHHNAGIGGRTGGGTAVYLAGKQPWQQDIYNRIVEHTGLKGNRAAPVDTKAGYTVLVKTKMPGVLLENGFMDSISDTPVILTESHAEKTADGIVEFIAGYAKLKRKQTQEGAKPVYCVQVGAFISKNNAGTLRDKLKRDGYEAAIVIK